MKVKNSRQLLQPKNRSLHLADEMPFERPNPILLYQ